MIKRSEVFLKELVFLIDTSAIVAAFVATYYFRQHLHTFYHLDLIPGQVVFKPLKPLEAYLWLLFFLIPIWLGTLHLMEGYRDLRTKSFGRICWVLLKTCVISLLAFGSLVFLLKLDYISRSFMVLFFVFSFSFLALERAVIIACFHVMLRRGYFHKKLLIVGTGRRAQAFIEAVQDHASWGLRLVGLVDQDPTLVGERIGGVRVIGTLDEFSRILKERAVDEVLFVVPRSWMTRIESAILECELIGVRATVAVDLFNIRFATAHPSDLSGTPLISFDTTPADQWELAIKRTMDIAMSVIGLLVLLPIFPLIVLLIKATSQGPVFFRQVRRGLNGRRFVLYKFRSMGVDAHAKQAELEHLNEMSGPVFKVANDPRLTPVGKWLRKTSIDELPQLFNVLKGEMSLVGPRPPLASEVEKYEPAQRRRLSMRPGLTGYWQVMGRNRIRDFDEWAKLDLEYIDNWSLLLDLKILLKTIPTVLLGIGAK